MSEKVQKVHDKERENPCGKLVTTVNFLLEKFVGGQIFFTELDKVVKGDFEILSSLIDATLKKWGEEKPLLVASGEVGIFLENFKFPVDILVPGGLRFEPKKIDLAPFKKQIEGKKVVFVDDSYFSGRTVEVVKEAVESLGGIFLGAYVVYDGAKEKNPEVFSLYRYYDYHDEEGNPLDDRT